MLRPWKMIMTVLLGLAPFAAGTDCLAQERAEGAGEHALDASATRVELRALLEKLKSALTSNVRSDDTRAGVRRSVMSIRTRLREGDFSAGDRLIITIGLEEAVSDTVIVQSGRTVTIDGIGTLSLAGVLRSELETHLTRQIARFIRDPVVRALVLIPLAITGQVEDPGFYLFPPDALLRDVVMAAGGPTREASLNDMRVERGDRAILEGENLEQAIGKGRTLEQMDLRGGDRVVIPGQTSIDAGELLRLLLLAVPTAVLAVSQIFGA